MHSWLIVSTLVLRIRIGKENLSSQNKKTDVPSLPVFLVQYTFEVYCLWVEILGGGLLSMGKSNILHMVSMSFVQPPECSVLFLFLQIGPNQNIVALVCNSVQVLKRRTTGSYEPVVLWWT